MSTTAIGASFSFTSPSRIQASQPGRTREVDPATTDTGTQQTANKAAGSVLDTAKAISSGNTVVQATLLAAQEERSENGSDRVQEAAKAYRG